MLSAFVVAQLVFDVAVVAMAFVYLVTKRPPAPAEPPEWYGHFLKLAQDLMAATEPVLERLESRSVPDTSAPAWKSTHAHELAALNGRKADERLSAGTVEAPVAPAPAPGPDKYDRARAMLRAGERPEDVASHVGLTAGEMRMLTRIVAAETRPRSR